MPKEMPFEIFEKLHVQLAELAYSGRICYHFLSEPLLRKDLSSLVRMSRSYLPQSWQVLFSNGDLLDDARYEELVEAGIDQIVVTSHDNVRHPKRPKVFVQYASDLELSNRGGALRHLPSATPDILKSPCYAPSEMLIVTATGDVLLCYEDAFRQHPLGNVCSSSLEDIWNSPSYVRLRSVLARGEREQAAEICRTCTNRAHTVAGKSAASEPFWQQLDPQV